MTPPPRPPHRRLRPLAAICPAGVSVLTRALTLLAPKPALTASLCLALAGLVLAGVALPARAGDGHDHGDSAPAVTAGPALPRFAAGSESFELVGVLQGRRITLYLDRSETNRPVAGAEIHLELAGQTYPAQAHDDVYEVDLPAALTPGEWPLLATVQAEGEVDQLAADLDLHGEGEPAGHAHDHDAAPGWAPPWPAGTVAALAALAALTALTALIVVTRARRSRQPPGQGTAAMALPMLLLPALLGLALGQPAPARAGEGHDHDHGGAAATPNANGPQRRPDGSVFLPKPAQRQLGLRTLTSAVAPLPRSTELPGMVVMDPNAGGRVQPLHAGRIEPGPRGLPLPGQAVRKGELLAWVLPSAAPLERAAQAAQLAELKAARDLAERRLARLQLLVDTVPRKEIEAAESELRSLAERSAALGQGLEAREALLAPVSGVIASLGVVAGQVVDARELVAEIVDPARLRIEALAYDPALAGQVGSASLTLGSERVALRYLGAARSLREQALPLQFSAQGPALATLAVGQAVTVYVQLRERVQGQALPQAALVRNAANQTIVWVKAEPERFEPRSVTVQPLDGQNVAITAGLKPGDRVVSQGAALLNQIR